MNRSSLTLSLMVGAIALLLFTAMTPSTLVASPQGKGGAIKPAPTPAPVVKKTTPPKRSTSSGGTPPRSISPKSGDANAVELAFWNSIKDSTDPEDFRAYLKKYPNGQFADLAHNRIRTLEAANAKPIATPTPTEQPKSAPATTEAKVEKPAPTPPPGETKANAPNHFEKAKALQSSDREAAETEYRLATQLDPDNAQYHEYLSLNLSVQCKNSEAEAEMREAVRLGPTYDRYRMFSNTLQANEKYDEGLAALKEAERLIKPGYAPWHQLVGLVLAKMGKWREADAEFREMIRLSEDPADGHLYYSFALSLHKKYAEAEIEMKEAIRLAKKENAYRYHNRLGDIYGYEKKWAEAEAEKREALRTYSGSSHDTYLLDLARTLTSQGKLAEADGVFQEGIRSFPEEYDIRQWYGVWLVEQKRYVDAEAQYREAIRLSKYQSPYNFAGLANALKGQNKFAEAETEYRKALHIDPYNLRALFGLPGLFEQQNKLKEAEAEFQTLIKAYCSWASAHGDYGDFLGRQKRWKEAEARYREAARLSPMNDEYAQKLQAAIDAQKK